MKNNIILIGFMGVGKGTIARELASQTNMYGVDSDDLIESLSNMKIKDIFDNFGEKHFRELENKTSIWLEHNIQNTIISTGGGFYKQKNIKNIGTIIYLKSSFDDIINRLKSHKNADAKMRKRPLLKNLKEAKLIYAQRVDEYKKIADITIEVKNKSSKKVVKKIISKLKL
jgi:shikimate kinase